MILYEGPSLIDGHPIVVLATGLDRPSANRKTGPMVQTWILRADVDPRTALDSGDDHSICGNCPARNRWCYAVLGPQGAALVGIHRTYTTGGYPPLDESRLRRRAIRFGAYGDPAAAPVELWDRLAGLASSHTGYTHQWRRCDQALRRTCMASVDSLAEAVEAEAKGWRYFRVVTSYDNPRAKEVICPNVTTGITCEQCGYCNGGQREFKGNVIIEAHGTQAKRFIRIEEEKVS